ncbi:flagellar biosynthetic protein FliO [Sandaracinus amylolyticus]|uniref:Flagellar protein n=1 Tax=Sandaracinus amylolyticus TaxID=927083 RepID=A0A0F6W6U2_9BACT|nr:flagellar biosynthetic protein FliO [Sandaracinus amylolyticus]AKF08752.1 hypothetical protein DB32_005901 [Sandaracinus amylolyticus]
MFLLLQAELPGGYGVALLQSLLALAAVCVLAWVVLRWASQRGLGTFARGTRVKVIERVPLDARRTLWLVKVGGKVLLIGAGDGASPTTLTELREDELPDEPITTKGATFVEVLRRAASGAPKRVEARPEETERPP